MATTQALFIVRYEDGSSNRASFASVERTEDGWNVVYPEGDREFVPDSANAGEVASIEPFIVPAL